ncbi:MAG TPA: transposase [Gemmatimonadales bacterium]|nr:transposase [Gemmatimonadales bacterium]
MTKRQLGLEQAVRAGRRGKGVTAEVAAVKRALGRPKKKPTWGGERAGAGRKPKVENQGAEGVEKATVKHRARPFLDPKHPVHVTLRVTREVGRLRRRTAYDAFRRAMAKTLARTDFRVVHVSIQANHVHLICEADDRIALAKGVRGLSISAAHRLNTAIGEERGTKRRCGRVFTDRYHARIIDSPRHARNELAYVLNNWRHHREDLAGPRQRRAKVDPYSSGVAFPGWAGVEGWFAWPPGYEPLPVSWPRTWLLTTGWRRWGEIGLREVP